MTSFKKYMAVKQRLNETKSIPKTMNQNFFIRKELSENIINEEWIGQASTSGGEIDVIAASVGAAGAMIMKSLYNGIIYKSLKSELPKYLEQYKEVGANKSRDVWDAKMGKQVEKLKAEKAMLLGTGGSRSDSSTKEDGGETSAKEKITDAFAEKITAAAKDEDKKKALVAQRKAAYEKIDLKVQKLQKAIEILDIQTEKGWEVAKEKWRQYQEKFKEKTDKFVEVGGMFASSWKKKWETEFEIAKREAEIEVLVEAKTIAVENNDKKEIDAITKSIERTKDSKSAADKALADIEKESDEKENNAAASAEELGVNSYIAAEMAKNEVILNSYNKWGEIAEKLKDKKISVDDIKQKDAIADKIASIQAKKDKAIEILATYKEKASLEKDEDKKKAAEDIVKRAEDLITKFDEDIKKEEANVKIGESLSDADYYSLVVRLDEILKMYDNLYKELGVYEAEDKKKSISFSNVKTEMLKAINAAGEDKKDVAVDVIKDIENIKNAEAEAINARNSMVESISKAKDEDKGMPEGFDSFTKMGKVEPDEKLKPYDDFSEKLKSDDFEEEPEVKDKPEVEEEPEVEKPTKEKPEEDPEVEKPTKENPEEEPEKEVPEENPEEQKLKAEIANQTDKINAINKSAKDSKSPLNNPDVLKKALEPEEQKLKDLQSKLDNLGKEEPAKENESITIEYPKTFMKFEEFLAIKNKSK